MDQYIGKLLDNRYELLERIGTGGMAVVYKARCHRLNRLVAVKILKPELAEDAEFRRRFHDESQAVAMLSHPNIVSVYDVSRSDNLDYIVMELIDGITLKQFMKKRGTPLVWREALHFIIQIVKALGHAHGRGIVHRDIKPHNVMVLRDGSVKVADFGIARLASAAHSTLTQEALGSVHYISPEQARGSHIDGRSDIYSAGVVLYEMITGRLPYEGETPVSVAIQHINSIPISPRELNPDLPQALEAITLKAMMPDPNQRYASADEMLADLEEFRKNPNISLEYLHVDGHSYGDKGEEAHSRGEGDDVVSSEQEPEQDAEEKKPNEEDIELPGGEDTFPVRESVPSREMVPARRADTAVRRTDTSSRRRREEYDEEYYYEPRRRSKLPAILMAILVIGIFAAGILAFLWNGFFSALFEKEDTFRVPDLRGLTSEEIFADIGLTDKWSIIISPNYDFSSEYSYGEVARQDPSAGTTVRNNNLRIVVYLSKGEENIDDGPKMPAVVAKDVREARRELAQLQTELSLIINEMESPSENFPSGRVIFTDPLAGSPLTVGQVVTITVSSGPQVLRRTVPHLENMLLDEAMEKISEYGLVFEFAERVYHDTMPVGYVVMQSIPDGTEVDAGTLIRLQVSMGPRPVVSDEPTPPPTDDPNPPVTDDPNPPATGDPNPPVTDDPNPPVTGDPNPPATDDPNPPATDDPNPPATGDPNPPPVQSEEPTPPPDQPDEPVSGGEG